MLVDVNDSKSHVLTLPPSRPAASHLRPFDQQRRKRPVNTTTLKDPDQALDILRGLEGSRDRIADLAMP